MSFPINPSPFYTFLPFTLLHQNKLIIYNSSLITFFCIFAPLNYFTMQDTTIDFYTVSIPSKESKRFKALVKAMGWNFRKMNRVEKSLSEVEEGKVYSYDSLDDFIKEMNV